MFRFAKEQGKDAEEPIEEPDVKVEVFEMMMKYIYTDELLDGLDEHNVDELIYAGEIGVKIF